VHAREMRKGFAHRLAGLAVRHHRRQLELRMPRDQAQQLAGHIAGTAEHDRGNLAVRVRHAAAPSATRVLPESPTASITRSPSAAPLLMALNADTPSCFSMMSTPTLLSVAGPVTTHGSTPKRSRSSFTPPHAATGSFADNATPVSAARMSGQSRIESTPYV